MGAPSDPETAPRSQHEQRVWQQLGLTEPQESGCHLPRTTCSHRHSDRRLRPTPSLQQLSPTALRQGRPGTGEGQLGCRGGGALGRWAHHLPTERALRSLTSHPAPRVSTHSGVHQGGPVRLGAGTHGSPSARGRHIRVQLPGTALCEPRCSPPALLMPFSGTLLLERWAQLPASPRKLTGICDPAHRHPSGEPGATEPPSPASLLLSCFRANPSESFSLPENAQPFVAPFLASPQPIYRLNCLPFVTNADASMSQVRPHGRPGSGPPLRSFWPVLSASGVRGLSQGAWSACRPPSPSHP